MSWIEAVKTFAPLVLSMIPQTAPIAGSVAAGIQEAEALKNASSADKKAHVIGIAQAAIEGYNAEAGAAGKATLNHDETIAAVSAGVDAVVHSANVVVQHQPIAIP